MVTLLTLGLLITWLLAVSIHITPPWIALIGTIFGGVGLKVVERYLSKDRFKVTDAAQIRDELRMEIVANREEISGLEKDVDKWRDEYYDLRDKYVQLQTELTLALERIKNLHP